MGTLAPIVASAVHAQAADRVTRPLAQLARLVPVAVVSGRAQRDLIERLPCEIAYLVGNHGNEGLPEDTVTRQLEEDMRPRWRGLRARPTWSLPERGARLEDKGRSLSMHYRAAPILRRRACSCGVAYSSLPQPTVIQIRRWLRNLLPPC